MASSVAAQVTGVATFSSKSDPEGGLQDTCTFVSIMSVAVGGSIFQDTCVVDTEISEGQVIVGSSRSRMMKCYLMK